jgi:DNA-binding GntR family transcriptional regulator
METINPLDMLKVETNLRARQTAAGYVADSLRTAIQTGALSDGTELNQVALAEHFGISRVPVREALRALEAEGWITALPHRRAVVAAISPERVQETFEIRALLESHLIEKAVARIGDGKIAELEAKCKKMDAIEDHHAWVAANADFHHALLESAESPMTLELIVQLSSQVERYLRLRGEDVIRESEAGREHRDIIRAVAARDAAGARELIRTHIDHTRERVIDALGEQHSSAGAHDSKMEKR